ncbi:MAG: sortase [bacterium]|nr:sortase [bacterium]
MALYRYVKKEQKKPRRKLPVALSFFSIILGSGLLLWVGWPIISFMIFTAPIFTKPTSPLPDAVSLAAVRSGKVLASETDFDGSQSAQDFTDANTWFPTRPQQKILETETYTLSIPKLEIENAVVTVGGDDLNKSLVHYGGTALPGHYGRAVIFGHSILPQFYNPKEYKSIFSLLPTLKIGDTMYITYDGVRYRYAVYEMSIHEPEDLSVLEQQFDDSYITLVTCVPPGTYLKRLNVKARLQSL